MDVGEPIVALGPVPPPPDRPTAKPSGSNAQEQSAGRSEEDHADQRGAAARDHRDAGDRVTDGSQPRYHPGNRGSQPRKRSSPLTCPPKAQQSATPPALGRGSDAPHPFPPGLPVAPQRFPTTPPVAQQRFRRVRRQHGGRDQDPASRLVRVSPPLSPADLRRRCRGNRSSGRGPIGAQAKRQRRDAAAALCRAGAACARAAG